MPLAVLTTSYEMQVRQDYQGRQLGAVLLSRVYHLALALHVPYLALTVFASNDRARRFYRRHAFLPLHKLNRESASDSDSDTVRATRHGRVKRDFFVLWKPVC